MARKIVRGCLPLLCCLLLAACGREGATGQPPSTQGPGMEPEAESAAQESGAEPEAAAPEPAGGASVLSAILGCEPGELLDFSYFDTPKLYTSEHGAVFPEDGAGAITFDCGYNASYQEAEDAFTLRLAHALAAYQVEGEAQVVEGEARLPAGQYFTVWPSLASGWLPVLTFFDSGEIYVDDNGGGDGLHRLWQARDPAQFDELKAVLEEIQSGLYALPLDYQLSMWLQENYFQPASQALRFGFLNNGKDTVGAESFTLEQEAGNGWQPMGEVATPDLEIAPYRQYSMYAIDLAAIPGARAAGKYRVTGTLRTDSETLPVAMEYVISEDATELSNPLKPAMTPEHQEYCDRYVGMWAFYSPFRSDFDEENYIREIHTYHMYYFLSNTEAEGSTEKNNRRYGTDLPAGIVEGPIMRHFLFTEDFIRAQTPTKEENPSEYYDPQTNTYHFEGGYGGGAPSAVVSDSRLAGDLLALTCDWYGMDDGYLFSQELTIRLGESETDFVYVAGRMLGDRQ